MESVGTVTHSVSSGKRIMRGRIRIMFDIPWYVFALMSAFFVGVAAVFEKRALEHDEPLHFSASSTVVVGLLTVPFLFFVDWSALTPPVIFGLYAVSILATIAFCLVAYALKRLEAGEHSLILSLTPAATALLAYLFIGEALSEKAAIGVLLVVCGLLALEFPRAKAGFRSKEFRKKLLPLLLSFGAVIVYALSAVLDRVLLSGFRVDPIDFIVIVQTMQLLNFVVYGIFRGKKDHLLSSSFMRQPMKVLAFSLLMFLSRIFYAQSVSMAFVALTAALKRTGALFTIVFARSYLHEHGVGHKLLAGAIILSGVLLVVG